MKKLNSSAVVSLAFLSVPALAQQALQSSSQAVIPRVEITGSSIKRISAEGALPVQTITRAQIEQSGLSSVADVVAALPSMQGFITASSSVNGGGEGVQSASVHAIGTDYTLVLLNGRRMAPYGTGSAVNLASIPLAAVERVEILTDGASTLYGSDAIGGVVNFILKKNQRSLNVEATASVPLESGGKSANFAISKGFGDLEADGYNLLLAYSHDTQKELNATQRDFAKTGVRRFNHNGKEYATWQTSINSTPANVEVIGGSGANAFDTVLSLDLLRNGKCSSPNTFERGGACRYDYAATVQLIPEMKRDSVFSSGSWRVNPDTTLFGELVVSRFSSTARYAPAAQPLSVFVTDPVSGQRTVNQSYLGAYNAHVVPVLPGLGVDPAQVTDAFLYYRGVDAGGRTDKWGTDALHAVLGADFKLMGWDLSAAYTHSRNKQTDDAVAGYISADRFEALVASGAYNPFLLNANGPEALAPAVLRENLNTIRSRIDVANLRTSKEIFDLPGGRAALGLGADFTRQRYAANPTQILQGPGPQHPTWTDVGIGKAETGQQTLDARRDNWGVFGELLMPLLKNLEATAAVRYDSYDAVDKRNTSYDVLGNANLPGKAGNDFSKATYKLSVRYTPTQAVLLRGSYGSGFKAPTMNDIADPLKNFGSSNFFACPITNRNDPRFLYCKPGSSEYNLLTVGNPATGDAGLKPETSRQATLGMRIEPVAGVSVGVDWWDVKLRNQVQALSQQQIFEDPALAERWIGIYYDPIQKSNVLAATLSPVNLSSSHYRGIDWDASWRVGATPLGVLSANWTGTYMLKAEQDVPGSATGIESSVGRFDSYYNVTFRTVSRLMLSLKSARLLNTLTMHYRTGYHDQPLSEDDAAVRVVNADGTIGAVAAMQRDVGDYLTVDYQLKAALSKQLGLTVGVRNLLDKDPPLSIRNFGGGNQVGYDGRYTDPLGRTLYVTASYKF